MLIYIDVMINRLIKSKIEKYLTIFPAVAIIGPRQCGKSTIAKSFARDIKNSFYLDLEKDSDLAKISNPDIFFVPNRSNFICLDEIQNAPNIFKYLRSEIDEDRRNGRFLILGSASPDLIKQSSESLAGRIGYIELTPFYLNELAILPEYRQADLWNRGGYPESYLAEDSHSYIWRENYIRTYVERDIPKLGFNIDSNRLKKMLQLIAHQQGQLLNYSKLGEILNISSQTARNHVELLESTFLLRVLRPCFGNLKKRLVKTPKVYVRDSGLLHYLLNIEDYNELLGHPKVGSSWEGFAIEQILSTNLGWEPSFYRTSHGSEIDLILEKKDKRIAIEFKLSSSPKVSKGFFISSKDLNINDKWVITPNSDFYFYDENTKVANLQDFLQKLEKI